MINTTEEFKRQSRLVHGDKYDYSLVEYKNAKTKVKIICPIHGIFEQRPDTHKKCGCKKCGEEAAHKKETLTQEEFLEKMKKIYNDLDFSEAIYRNARTPVKIHCNICGNDFEKTPNELSRSGCPKCGVNKGKEALKNARYKKVMEKINLTLQKCNVKLLDEYEGKYELKGHKWKRYTFECNECSYRFIDFFDDQHLQLCPVCNPGKNSSKGELELRRHIMDNFSQLKIVPNDRTVLEGKEIDIFIPELSIGFEYDGIYWHKGKEKYDKEKDALAKSKNIIIYHVQEKRSKKEILKNFEEVDKIIETCISSKEEK